MLNFGGCIFIFTPILGEMMKFHYLFFQRGWFNHQRSAWLESFLQWVSCTNQSLWLIHPRSLTVCPWKNGGVVGFDDPASFLLGPGKFSGVNSLLTSGGYYMYFVLNNLEKFVFFNVGPWDFCLSIWKYLKKQVSIIICRMFSKYPGRNADLWDPPILKGILSWEKRGLLGDTYTPMISRYWESNPPGVLKTAGGPLGRFVGCNKWEFPPFSRESVFYTLED